MNARRCPMLFKCWASVEDDVPTLQQQWCNVLCLIDQWLLCHHLLTLVYLIQNHIFIGKSSLITLFKFLLPVPVIPASSATAPSPLADYSLSLEMFCFCINKYNSVGTQGKRRLGLLQVASIKHLFS